MHTTFKIINIKKYFFPIVLILFVFLLVIFSENALLASKNAIKLWAFNIVPSLLPFFIATELLGSTNIFVKLGKFLNKITKKIFNVSGIASYPILMGLVSGYPIGAKIVTDLRIKNQLTKNEAERLITFTNNSRTTFYFKYSWPFYVN